MTISVRIPRMLSETVRTEASHSVSGSTVAEALERLFIRVPGLRNHILDEGGLVRRHVSVFVDGVQADLDTRLGDDSEIRVLHAVSGGSPSV